MRSYPVEHRNPRRLRYGWRLTASGHIVVDAAARASIYRILELRANAYTLQQICAILHAENRPAPRHTTWYCATVKKIVEQNNALSPHLARLRTRGHGSGASAPSGAAEPTTPSGDRDEDTSCSPGRPAAKHMHQARGERQGA